MNATVTIETADALATEVVDVIDLSVGEYVLLPEDAEEQDIDLLVDEEYEKPIVARVDRWSESVDAMNEVTFTGPEGDVLGVTPGPDEQIRRILPDQDHPRWDPPE